MTMRVFSWGSRSGVYWSFALRLALLVWVITATGCARWYWTKAGFTQDDWNRDSYECERDMRQSGYYGGGVAGAIEARNFQERCLVARGYYKERANSGQSSGPNSHVVPSEVVSSVPVDQAYKDCMAGCAREGDRFADFRCHDKCK
jgi:hypothetical protein